MPVTKGPYLVVEGKKKEKKRKKKEVKIFYKKSGHMISIHKR
jgi:hypothetical protein